MCSKVFIPNISKFQAKNDAKRPLNKEEPITHSMRTSRVGIAQIQLTRVGLA